MGFFKKVFRPIRKIAKKIIPKEVRPFLPYAAAFTPGLQGLAAAGGITNVAAQKALIAGLTAAATDEDANILRTAALAGGPDLLSSGLGKLSQAGNIPFGPQPQGSLSGVLKAGQQIAQSGSEILKPTTFTGKAKLIGSQAAVDQAAKLAEINQDEIDKYNEELRKRGVLDKTKRRTSILNIYLNAGYEPDYVNSMLDRYGYESGGRIGFAEGLGIFDEDILENISRGYKGSKAAMTNMFKKKKKKKEPEMTLTEKGKIIVNFPEDDDERPDDLSSGLQAAAAGVEKAFGTPFGGVEPAEFKRFAQGGEVEIEEETDDLGIMDLMKDQGIEYGEQASYGFDDAMGESFEMFQDYRKRGLIPLEMEFDEFLEIMRDSKKSKDGIMQMASAYKTDIEEMYEQYVFEMEEQGLQPMSFSDFLRQARSGMADGGIMEKDMRGGGFIPEGTKERADDVPARLSKNEFVMTADAVRAAGGGSVNKGAKRMYDMMYNLEGKV
jgi:predicted transcriptional regulator